MYNNNVALEHWSDGGWKWAPVHLCRCSDEILIFYYFNAIFIEKKAVLFLKK